MARQNLVRVRAIGLMLLGLAWGSGGTLAQDGHGTLGVEPGRAPVAAGMAPQARGATFLLLAQQRDKDRDRDGAREEDGNRDRDKDRDRDQDRNKDEDKDKITVTLTAPANGALYTAPASVALVAAATGKQKNHPIVKVEFFAGATLIGTVPGPRAGGQYAFNWTNAAAGTYTLTAKATNDKGDSGLSNAVTIKVIAPPTVNAPPTVSLSAPANGALFIAPAAITLSANATDADGTIAKVVFYSGAMLIGTATTSPYSATLANAAAGSYSFTAVATDNRGAATRSAPVGVIVNAPPSVAITAPANSMLFNAPATIVVTASATDSDGTIAKVGFFDGVTPVGTATAAPYSITLTNVVAGTHALTAVATDDRGAATTSAAVTVIVNSPPTVAITAPANNTVFTAPANVAMTAIAADGDGTVAKVDFYAGATLIGTATTAPYSFTWANVAAGNYSFTAVATDNHGAATTSAAVAIGVNGPPTVAIGSPASGAVFSAPANIVLSASATDPDGTVAKVAFYQGGTLITTLSAAPYSFTWSGVPAGSYSLTAIATDNQGAATTSTAVTLKVNAAPTLTLTSPTQGARFTAPATITLSATATDTDGTIARVDFYQGTTLVGSAATTPYSFTLNNVAAGSYSFTAVATDSDGASTTSAAVSVTVKSGIAQIYYIHPDHLNTPRLIADATGTTVWRWDQQEPFGNDSPNGDPNTTGTTFEFPLRFPGQYYDRETNLAYNYFRDYDPATGRYMQTDPLGARSGKHLFLYSSGNPMSHIDYYALRDVIVTIWDRSIQNGSLAGHVYVGEMNGTTILSQFPSPQGIRGANITRDWFDTLISEMRNPDVVYKVHVSDDAQFDQAVNNLTQRPNWFWNPRNDPNSTNCSAAASSALRAGGVSVPEPSIQPISPDDLRSGMEQLIRNNSQNVTRLPSVPWK